MTAGWIVGTAKELKRELRKPGGVRGHSEYFKRYIVLPKTDLIADLSMEADDAKMIYRIDGDPNQGGRYAKDRRTVTIWLGKR